MTSNIIRRLLELILLSFTWYYAHWSTAALISFIVIRIEIDAIPGGAAKDARLWSYLPLGRDIKDNGKSKETR